MEARILYFRSDNLPANGQYPSFEEVMDIINTFHDKGIEQYKRAHPVKFFVCNLLRLPINA